MEIWLIGVELEASRVKRSSGKLQVRLNSGKISGCDYAKPERKPQKSFQGIKRAWPCGRPRESLVYKGQAEEEELPRGREKSRKSSGRGGQVRDWRKKDSGVASSAGHWGTSRNVCEGYGDSSASFVLGR